MSANNQVVISRDKGNYRIVEVDIECGGGSHIGSGVKTLEEAVLMANEYMDKCSREGYPVEYGLDVRI